MRKNAKTATPHSQTQPANSAYEGEGTCIRMDAKRSTRFTRELARLYDDIESLSAISKQFPILSVAKGEIQPKSVLEAFMVLMNRRAELLLAMVNCEEEADGGANENH